MSESEELSDINDLLDMEEAAQEALDDAHEAAQVAVLSGTALDIERAATELDARWRALAMAMGAASGAICTRLRTEAARRRGSDIGLC